MPDQQISNPYVMIEGEKVYKVKRYVGRNRYVWTLPKKHRRSRIADVMERMER